ncbi:MAG: Uma2 family endonuclease [Ignavibacteriae bacterium]|nr:Uma2 family endonuclease [Ignavibacteriota bacterium]
MTFAATDNKKKTSRDYERLPEGVPYQLIDGELIMTPSPSYRHQDIVYELASQLRRHVKDHSLGIAVGAPMDVHLGETEVYQPDVIYVSNARKNIVQDCIRGVPDLVMEVLSPSSAYYDLVHKKNIYEGSGVLEYWIVDPQEMTVEVYENRGKQFAVISKTKNSGTVHSKTVQGFTLNLATIFPQP